MDDFGEELFFFFGRITIIEEHFKRSADDKLIEFFDLIIIDSDIDLVVFSFNMSDFAIENNRMFEMVVDTFPNGLGSVFPCPKFSGMEELTDSVVIKIFQNIGCRNLIEVTITEGSERSFPDEFGIGAFVLLEEFRERHAEIF